MGLQWLRASVPGFNILSDAERSAIGDFVFLWSLFEARILGTHGNAGRIIAAADGWRASGKLVPEIYGPQLAYFRNRYFANGVFTYHFDHLHLRPVDFPDLVRSVLDGSNDDSRDGVVAVFIIIFRYRNNLFHGTKWEYRLEGQLDNFTHANTALMNALDLHGQLASV